MLCKLLLVESGTQHMAIFQKDWINVTKWVQVSLINKLFRKNIQKTFYMWYSTIDLIKLKLKM